MTALDETAPANTCRTKARHLFEHLETREPFDVIRARRHWTAETIDDLEAVTSQALPDIETAVGILAHAAADRLEVTVLTDYDMDGVAAGLLAYAGLNELRLRTNLVVPHYAGPRDVTADKIEQALAQYPNTRVIITCDVGINSNEGIDRAHQRGIPVIIADHHIEGEQPCRADAVVDPNRTGCDYPEPDICGSQVALHILTELARAHRPEKAQAIALLSLFGGIGGLADVMPLRGQTRALVRRALGLMSLALPEVPSYTQADCERPDNPIRWYQVGRWNIENPDAIDPDTSTLMQLVSGEEHHPAFVELFRGVSLMLARLIGAGKIKSLDDIDASFLGFTWTPMFNATRRVLGDMADSFMVFAPAAVRASRPEFRGHQENAGARIDSADTIIANNELRKLMFAEALDEMAAIEQPLAPLVYFSGQQAAPGVLGLLASRMSEDSGLPAVVVHPDTLSGSARAPEWADVLGIVKGLNRPGLFAAGHHQACGVRAETTADLEALARAFADAAAALPQETVEGSRADLHLADIEVIGEIPTELTESLRHIDMPLPSALEMIHLITQLNGLAPFGQGFPEPDIRITFQPKHSTVKLMSLTAAATERIERERAAAAETGEDFDGRTDDPNDYKHLKITTGHNMDLLWWNCAPSRDELLAADLATATITLSINAFGYSVKPQAIVSKMELHHR